MLHVHALLMGPADPPAARAVDPGAGTGIGNEGQNGIDALMPIE